MNDRDPNLMPLTYEERIETDPENGAKIFVKTVRRGILKTETYTYEDPVLGFQKLAEGSSRKDLEGYCEALRDGLERDGLPSDRTPNWVRVDGDWRPLEKDENLEGRAFAQQHWTMRLDALTEPLTIQRTAGKVLEAITELLAQKGIDEYLWQINRLVQTYSFLRVQSISQLANQGVAGRRARSLGPATRRRRTTDIRHVIADELQGFWAKHPLLKGDASNTAMHIAEGVNLKLLAKGLLPAGKSGLSAKTISDHIRAIPVG